MGDCRIKVVIAKCLLIGESSCSVNTPTSSSPSTTTTTRASTAVSIASMFSSDTTIREVLQGNEAVWGLLLSKKSKPGTIPDESSCRLWDCTIYPPVDISSWPLDDFPDLQGPKSKTLYAAGWFPSGFLMVIPSHMTPDQFTDLQGDEDLQYNILSKSNVDRNYNAGKVEFVDPALHIDALLPSQVMDSIASRFVNDATKTASALEVPDQQSRRIRQQHKEERRRKEQERAAKIEARIIHLEELKLAKTKNKNVSEQVRSMLVKSRATGDKNLKQMDRRYFECIILQKHLRDDEHADIVVEREYRYFSPQDTFAKIARTFAGSGGSTETLRTEVLGRRNIPGVEEGVRLVHRRFPLNMRIYEATADGYLLDPAKLMVETLIVRHYGEDDAATPLITEDLEDKDGDEDAGMEPSAIVSFIAQDRSEVDMSISNDSEASKHANTVFEDPLLARAIETLEGADKRKRGSMKNSTTAIKIQQMTMKSKAKGDNKRIPNVEDRFFLNVVVVLENASTVNSGYYFLAKTDAIERILQTCEAKQEPRENWDFLVPAEKMGFFQKLPSTAMTAQMAEDQGLLRSFGRLILRQMKK